MTHVYLRPNSSLSLFLEKLSETSSKTELLQLNTALKTQKFKLDDIKVLKEFINDINEKEDTNYSLSELFKNTGGINIETLSLKEPQIKSKEYLKRRQRLLQLQQTRSYETLLNSTQKRQGQHKQLNKSSIKSEVAASAIAINIITMVGGVFIAGYFWIHKILGKSHQTGLIIGLILSIFMFFIEIILFVIRDERLQKKQKQKIS